MSSKYKIAFIDIDWTILNHEDGHYFDMPSIEALKKAQDQGVLIYIVTARPYASVRGTGLFEYLTPDGIITNNGGLTFINDEIVFQNTIPPEVMKEVLHVANKHNVTLQLSMIKDRYFSRKPNQYVKNYFSIYYEDWPKVKHQAYDNVSDIIAFIPEKYDAKMMEELPSSINYYRYDNYGVNLSYFKNKKGDAIIKLLNHLNIAKENALAIGDSQDDISMFEAVGTSIAMGNSKDEIVKEKATIVADTINNHGVALIIANLLF